MAVRRWLLTSGAAVALVAPLLAGGPAEAVRVPAAGAGVAPQAVALAPIGSIRLSAATVGTGLVSPVSVTSADDGSSRLFVVEQAGRVVAVRRGVLSTYLDIRGLVRSGSEQGMLGLAFAPDFASSHLLWVTYTRADGALVLDRFTAASATAASVDPATRHTVLVVPHPTYGNHNGGAIAFGPGGYLFLGTGDGGGGGDPGNNAQNGRSLLGKMLRIDVRCASSTYCIPPTNPFATSTTVRKEIWLTGLRNPWRWSFDGRVQWIGDVGQSRWEEIDAVSTTTMAGRNLGWSCREGTHTYNASRCRTVSYLQPVAQLCHLDAVSGCRSSTAGEAIIGGHVYRGPVFPAFQGTYVFGDFVAGRIWPYKNGVIGVPSSLPQVAGFGVDDNQELYAVTLSGRLVHVKFAAV